LLNESDKVFFDKIIDFQKEQAKQQRFGAKNKFIKNQYDS